MDRVFCSIYVNGLRRVDDVADKQNSVVAVVVLDKVVMDLHKPVLSVDTVAVGKLAEHDDVGHLDNLVPTVDNKWVDCVKLF